MCIDKAWMSAKRLALLSGGLMLATTANLIAGPEVQSWHTSKGAKVLFVEAPGLPMLDLRIAFDAGSARDGERPGIASLTAGLLTQGAGDWNADEIAERVESIGAELSVSADRDMATASLRTLTAEPVLDQAVTTLARVLAAPRFTPKDIERVRHNRLIALRLDEQDPGDIGRKALYQAIFGDHPYASDPDGTAQSVEQLQQLDFQRFHQWYYRASGATVAMVGAVSRAQAETIAETVTARLPEGPPPPALPPVQEPTQHHAEAIEFPSSQTHVYAGVPGMKRGDPDYFPLYVGNHILGGSGLVSLLMEEVREKRGLSYSVYSYFLPLAKRGPFIMGLQTKNAQADQAEDVLFATLEDFVNAGPTEEQLAEAVKNITGGFPLKIASNGKIVSYLAVIGFYDLPLDYLDRFTDRIEAVTREEIRDAFRRRIRPEHFQIVRVGDRADPSGEGEQANSADNPDPQSPQNEAPPPAGSESSESMSKTRGPV